MQENICSDIWGETLHKKDVGMRVYIYNPKSTLYNPALILGNSFAIDQMIEFLKKAKKELNSTVSTTNASQQTI